MKCTAIVLAAGRGSRMGSTVHKQYMELAGYPVLYYSLKAFEDSFVDEVVLVAGEEDIMYCHSEIIQKYGLKKVSSIVPGGSERYFSVYRGLCAVRSCDYVLIHDGARPFVDEAIMKRTVEAAREYGSGIAAVPAKDTMKVADEGQFVVYTPPREHLWMVQTPQTFPFEEIKGAYKKVVESGIEGITDDAMVMEQAGKEKIKLVEGSYRNIKITTPEDMIYAKQLCKSMKNKM